MPKVARRKSELNWRRMKDFDQKAASLIPTSNASKERFILMVLSFDNNFFSNTHFIVAIIVVAMKLLQFLCRFY